MTHDRERLRGTFDSVASLYDAVRPGYPDALFEDVISLSEVPSGGRILEVGSGTGQATMPLARRGYEMLCIELGENLAEFARQNLAEYPQVEIRAGRFEDWPVEEKAFDLVVSAESFHWLDPEISYRKIYQALKPGGAVVVFWNRHVWSERSESFFEAAQRIYERVTPGIVRPEDHKGLPHPDDVSGRTEGIEETGLFKEIIIRKYPWEGEYDAAGYIRLLNTYSGHISLNEDARNRLFRGIANLIDDQFGGRIVKQYLTVLYVARADSP